MLTGPSGSLSSPNHPRQYYNNQRCVWIVTVPQGTIILTFTAFDIEIADDCKYDRLVVRMSNNYFRFYVNISIAHLKYLWDSVFE